MKTKVQLKLMPKFQSDELKLLLVSNTLLLSEDIRNVMKMGNVIMISSQVIDFQVIILHKIKTTAV